MTDADNSPDQSPGNPLAERLSDLESLLTHLQRTVGDLDEILLAQGKRLDHLQQSIDRLGHQVETIEVAPGEARDVEDEKPPHY